MPHVGAIVTSQSLTNAGSFLPPDIIGWEKRNAVLMHPDTMSKLHILPRGPCWLTNIGVGGNSNPADAQCVTVWPCNEVCANYSFPNCNSILVL